MSIIADHNIWLYTPSYLWYLGCIDILHFLQLKHILYCWQCFHRDSLCVCPSHSHVLLHFGCPASHLILSEMRTAANLASRCMRNLPYTGCCTADPISYYVLPLELSSKVMLVMLLTYMVQVPHALCNITKCRTTISGIWIPMQASYWRS